MFSNSRGFTNVTVNAPKGTTLTMRNLALNLLTTRSDCDVVYDDDTIINYVYNYAPTDLYGYGQINRLYCYSNGVYYDAKPLYIETGAAMPPRPSGSTPAAPARPTRPRRSHCTTSPTSIWTSAKRRLSASTTTAARCG